MEEFTESCDLYYKIFTNREDSGYKYRSLSPFEFNDALLRMATKSAKHMMLDASNGNPNFFAVAPRYALSLLTDISIDIGDSETSTFNVGLVPYKKDIIKRFNTRLWKYRGTDEGKFLKKAIERMQRISGIKKEDLIHQMVTSAVGCIYPNPSRVQEFVQPILTEFFEKVIYKTGKSLKNKIKVFPTEGSTAAILYVLNSLKYNAIVIPGDSIAVLTPIYSPYLEIAGLLNYNFIQVCIKADSENNWEISESELQKLADQKVKAVLLCNPSNPTSVSLSIATTRHIKSIIKQSNPNLVIISNNEYAPFTDQFNGLFDILPYNTISIYSFSKYFGTTGWRLGNIVMADSNVIDKRLLKDVDDSVHSRYSMISNKPESIPFIERIMLDSRQVALSHTAGLSTPQQTIMTMFAMFELMDAKHEYKKSIKNLLERRRNNVLTPIHYTEWGSETKDYLDTNYHVTLDLIKVVNGLVGGSDFGDYLKNNRDPLEFLIRLAKEYATVLLPTIGFAGPFWGISISLVNLDTDDYVDVGENIRTLIDSYYEEFQRWKESERKKEIADAKKT